MPAVLLDFHVSLSVNVLFNMVTVKCEHEYSRSRSAGQLFVGVWLSVIIIFQDFNGER